MDALFGLPVSTGTVICVLARAHDGSSNLSGEGCSAAGSPVAESDAEKTRFAGFRAGQ
jgi:hypothetical protein